MIEKPNPEDDDPVEMAAIKDAAERMGDYKLKTARDYTVPDHLRMNTDKARSRLLIVKEKVSFSLYRCLKLSTLHVKLLLIISCFLLLF